MNFLESLNFCESFFGFFRNLGWQILKNFEISWEVNMNKIRQALASFSDLVGGHVSGLHGFLPIVRGGLCFIYHVQTRREAIRFLKEEHVRWLHL